MSKNSYVTKKPNQSPDHTGKLQKFIYKMLSNKSYASIKYKTFLSSLEQNKISVSHIISLMDFYSLKLFAGWGDGDTLEYLFNLLLPEAQKDSIKDDNFLLARTVAGKNFDKALESFFTFLDDSEINSAIRANNCEIIKSLSITNQKDNALKYFSRLNANEKGFLLTYKNFDIIRDAAEAGSSVVVTFVECLTQEDKIKVLSYANNEIFRSLLTAGMANEANSLLLYLSQNEVEKLIQRDTKFFAPLADLYYTSLSVQLVEKLIIEDEIHDLITLALENEVGLSGIEYEKGSEFSCFAES